MRLSSRLSFFLVIVSATLALSAGQARRGATLRGPASGVWDFQTGFVLGTLDTIEGGETLYQLQATLLPYPVMCPACLVGEVSGILDDGVGPGPDFLVEGGYGGVTFGGGSGTFDVTLRRPSGARAGSMHGSFSDGSFVARYAIRR